LPSIENLHRTFQDEPFAVLTIDVGEERREVRNFIRKHKYSFPVLLDTDMLVAEKYHIRQHPMKFLIDTDGRMVGYAAGYGQWDDPAMKILIRKLLEDGSKI
jgi:peroxiredoxin